MQTVTPEFVSKLVDFAPTEQSKRLGYAESQLAGTVAIFNRLVRNDVAYVADEVGLGKTYIALATMGLLRHFNPAARIMVLTPRENIQHKWVKELRNFTRDNWTANDTRFRDLGGKPARRPMTPGNIESIARTLHINDHAELFLRYTTFSLSVKSSEARKRARKQLAPYVPWANVRKLLDARQNPDTFRDSFARVLNAIIPPIDLLVVDEAHAFKHGFGPNVSNRNRMLGMMLGHPEQSDEDCPWYAPRVKRLLLLSATPFEDDYADIYRQLQVFGYHNRRLRDLVDGDAMSIADLSRDIEMEAKREVVQRLMVRRVSYLNVADRRLSKNLYRREWRRGGYGDYDKPMQLDNPKQRLVVGLIQKKLAELLGDDRFNNSFQIGMLSSFESFIESLGRSQKFAPNGQAGVSEEDEDEQGRVFDGDQTQDAREREGIDSRSIEAVVQSYRDRFGVGLPHPKLDTTAKALSDAFETGEKALVFVRRVATTGELKAKLDRYYDRWIYDHLRSMLPEQLHGDLDGLFDRYSAERRGEDLDSANPAWEQATVDEGADSIWSEDDTGDTDSFFGWFFRGAGPSNVLSGAAFKKSRLSSVSSAYATIFEDNYVSWLLGYPEDTLRALLDILPSQPSDGDWPEQLGRQAWGYMLERTKRQSGYPRLYRFEAYQFAALAALRHIDDELGDRARIVISERFGDIAATPQEPPKGFPTVDDVLNESTFFTELPAHADLRQAIWPEEARHDFRRTFRRREQRRELMSAQIRLGSPLIDLYCLAMRDLGSFGLRVEASQSDVRRLVLAFIHHLDGLRGQQGMHALYELEQAATSFDTLIAVNFPEVPDADLRDLSRFYADALGNQQPVGRMHGGVKKSMVRQFRMPGYPLVLTSTDVLQEGEDLHTFCRRVIHYGLTWTPSATEQRTGRIDRIGSLVQRHLDGAKHEPAPKDFIQVHYPHLADTIERLQVRRVLKRLNKFVRLIHLETQEPTHVESSVQVDKDILDSTDPPAALTELLESAFPPDGAWQEGELVGVDAALPDVRPYDELFEALTAYVEASLGLSPLDRPSSRAYQAWARLRDGRIVPWSEQREGDRQQAFRLEMRSQSTGDLILLRCTSTVGELDLKDQSQLDELYALQKSLRTARICTREIRAHRWEVTVEYDRLLHLRATQPDEVIDLVHLTVSQADQIELELFGDDSDQASVPGESKEQMRNP